MSMVLPRETLQYRIPPAQQKFGKRNRGGNFPKLWCELRRRAPLLAIPLPTDARPGNMKH